MRSVEYADKPSTLKVPTLVLAGDHDECDPALAQEMHDHIPGSRLVILPQSGYVTFVDQPALIIKTIREFLSDAR